MNIPVNPWIVKCGSSDKFLGYKNAEELVVRRKQTQEQIEEKLGYKIEIIK